SGVANPDLQFHLVINVLQQSCSQMYASRLREFQCVADQVDHDLSDPGRVAHQLYRNAPIHHATQLQTLQMSLQSHRFEPADYTLPEVERDRVQLHLTGFDLREVENLVDDKQ